jgi:hypothetical protein
MEKPCEWISGSNGELSAKAYRTMRIVWLFREPNNATFYMMYHTNTWLAMMARGVFCDDQALKITYSSIFEQENCQNVTVI